MTQEKKVSHPFVRLVDENGEMTEGKLVTDYLKNQVALTSRGESEETAGAAQETSGRKQTSNRQLSDIGLRYRVIAVFGGQSTGKSTLLNCVFGTNFQTMDDDRHRGQTTTGAYLSQSNKGENVFVIDFEGTDSVERGEDKTLERQLSLFALSIADTLIINMWAKEVGRLQAANLSLLQTVFEVNLQLFSTMDSAPVGSGYIDPMVMKDEGAAVARERPTLLFVLRDNDGNPETLLTSLKKSLDKVWEGVTKPKKYALCSIEALFDLKYQIMSHRKFQAKEFDEEVGQLQRKFTDPTASDYFFTSPETFRRVPLDGLTQYLGSCWESIKTSKDLNIPSQREMIARVRCEEISTELTQSFTEYFAEVKGKIKRGEWVLGISEVLELKVRELEAQFNSKTLLYEKRITQRKCRELGAKLRTQCSTLVRLQCGFIVKHELDKCDGSIQRLLDATLETLSDQDTAKEALRRFPESPAEAANFRIKKFWLQMRSGIAKVTSEIESAIRATAASTSEASESAAAAPASGPKALQSDEASMNIALQLLREGVILKLQARFQSMASSTSSSMVKLFQDTLTRDPATKKPRTFTNTKTFESAYEASYEAGLLLLGVLFTLRLEEPSSTMPDSELYLRFIKLTTDASAPEYPYSAVEAHRNASRLAGSGFDEERTLSATGRSKSSLGLGGPTSRDSSSSGSGGKQDGPLNSEEAIVEKMIELSFSPSRDASADAVDGAGEVSPQGPTTVVLLSDSAVENAFERYTQECRHTFLLETQRIASSRSSLPGWVYIAFLVLGWNEFWYVLSSPVLLIFLLFVVQMFFREVVKEKWAELEERGPPQLVLPLKTAMAFARPYLPKSWFHQPEQAAAADTKKDRESPKPAGPVKQK
jgi:hypothetical protein